MLESCPDPDVSQSVFERLRDEIARHREYSDTAWALTEEELSPLAAACDALEPQHSVRRHAWLFKSVLVELGNGSTRGNLAEVEDQLKSRRKDAVAEIVTGGGLPAVVELAEMTEYSGIVGLTLAQYSSDFDQEMVLGLTAEGAALRGVASAYVRERLREGDSSLLDEFVSLVKYLPAKARVLNLAPDPAAAWEKLGALDAEVAEHYWREFNYFGLGPFKRGLDAAWSLLDAGRPSAALDVISLYEGDTDTYEVAGAMIRTCG